MSRMKHVALSVLVSLMLISSAFRFELTKGDPVTIVVPDDFYTGPALGWNKTYGGAGSDFAVDFVHTTDGGYALVGSTGSFGAGSTDVWLVKTDALGNHLWNKTYGGTGADYANALVQTTDGGYAFVGYCSSGVSKDAWLVVVDASGNHLWNRTYGGVGEDRGYALVQTIDGGYALACSTSSFGAGSSDFWLVRTSADGSHEWNKTYGGTSMEDPLALIRTVDGGYALVGRTSSFGAGNTDFWLVKTDASGNHLWNRTYGGVGVERAYALVQAFDGGYALVGPTYSFGVGNGDVWLVKTDASGYHLWNRTYGGPYVDWVYSVIETSDGGYALAGPTYSYGAGSSDVWLVKTDALGNAEWNQTYGGTGEDYSGSLIQTSDGGFAIAGGTKSFGAGSDDFWLAKTVRDITTIIVPDDYSTIQEAINNAVDGDTVFVKAGTYYEHVVINKAVTLVGENSSTTIVDGNDTGSVISIIRDNSTVTNFTVQRGGGIMFPVFDAGISLTNARGCSIASNNIVDNGCAGIHLLGSEQNTISGNNFTRNVWCAIDLTTSSNNIISSNTAIRNPNIDIGLHDIGISLHASSQNNIILANTIINCTYGIDAARSSNNTISGNYLTNNSLTAIWVQDYATNNAICGNNVADGSSGIKIEEQADGNIVSGNTVTSCQFGIQVLNTRYTEICNNTIAHNFGTDEWDAGVRLDSAGYTLIHDNNITDNSRGIVLYASSPNVTIYGNNLTSNDYGIRVAMGGSNYVNVTGNYVADNRGYGIDVTGFGGGDGSNYATVARNLIVNNTFEAVGLGIGSSYNTVIQNSMIGNGHAGVTLERYSNYNTVVQNNIIGNAYGICFDLYTVNSTQNTIFNNNIIDNIQQIRMVSGSVNEWNGNHAIGGNYWSDYTGSDCRNGPSQSLAGCDGIGDTPYVIDSNNCDNYPLMKPFPWDSDDIGVTCLGKAGSLGVSSMKTVIAEGTLVHFSVFVMNYGATAEAFNVTTYINATLLETQTEVPILSRGCAVVNFTWDTSLFEKGSYAITAQVTAVPDETDTSDNSRVWAVAIGLVGDVDNNGIVDMLDVYNIALDFGALVGQAHYVSNYDIDDNAVINMLDLYKAAIHYGQTAAGTCVNVSVLARRSY